MSVAPAVHHPARHASRTAGLACARRARGNPQPILRKVGYTGFGVGETLVFHPAAPLQDHEITGLTQHIAALITGHLARRALLDADGRLHAEAGEDLDTLSACHAAAIAGQIPFGPRAGQQTLLWGDNEGADRAATPRPPKKGCADYRGYSLHAGAKISACNSARRERVCRYIARGPIAQDRLFKTRQGDVVYRFRRRWRNGTTAVVLDPMTFLSRLAALIPPPRVHLLSYYGVLAPAAGKRDSIVPGYPDADDDPASSHCRRHQPRAATQATLENPRKSLRLYYPWAELLRRTFLVDVLTCHCGARRRVLSMVRDPNQIRRCLSHLGLPTEAPARAPPRAVQGVMGF